MFCIVECIERGEFVFDIILQKWIIDETSKEFKWPGSVTHLIALKNLKTPKANWKTCKYNRILLRNIGKNLLINS